MPQICSILYRNQNLQCLSISQNVQFEEQKITLHSEGFLLQSSVFIEERVRGGQLCREVLSCPTKTVLVFSVLFFIG